ncbi:MAG: hypothetical protein K1V96_01550, partial [Lachnospiraceae bacterium]
MKKFKKVLVVGLACFMAFAIAAPVIASNIKKQGSQTVPMEKYSANTEKEQLIIGNKILNTVEKNTTNNQILENNVVTDTDNNNTENNANNDSVDTDTDNNNTENNTNNDS